MTPLQEHLFFLAITVIPGLAGLIPGWLAWTGRYRNWARQPKSTWSTTRYNMFPLHIGWIGFTWIMLWASLWIDYFHPGWTSSVPGFWLLFPFLVITVILNFWWPRFLTPAWHRDWVDRGGRYDTPLRGPDGP
ncbi:hypothetical protein GCM10010977_30710 [Citricoccus zhacaiensis]|uniref:DUF4870 domain-containing protein n=1 Tax=Citricoccus zhacaiensis TaxID=489142 RepID=A0ABQ2MBM5_9MICC|nr:hypothetical protein [Citricoccus zhacaiensis]GGO49254.1 hypothetical protein GCM10010977_30710 [Citricoccus zhacaiensis]